MQIQIRYHKPRFSKREIIASQETQTDELDFSYLLWTLFPEFRFTRYGLYLADGSIQDPYDMKYFKEHGKFASEGIINHVHLSVFARNSIVQFQIGVKAIWLWGMELLKSKKKNHIVIYLNESFETSRKRHYTLCIYSDPKSEELSSLEKQWRHPVTIVSYQKFIKEYHKNQLPSY